MIRICKVDSKNNIEIARELLLEYGRLRCFDIALGDYKKELLELPGEYFSPKGSLLIAFYNDESAGCVALRKIDENICEMKRLYVKQKYRGKKVGMTLVSKIIEEARRLGYKIMRLDTHPWMKDAELLYRSVGFNEIEGYHFNPIEGIKYFELNLKKKTGKIKVDNMDSMSKVYRKNIKSTPYGPVGIFWQKVNRIPKIIRILISKPGHPKSSIPPKIYPSSQDLSCDFIDDIADKIVEFLEGEAIDFSLENVDLSRCSQFQQNVLYAEHRIPRGCVSTYHLIARYLRIKNGARAVGNALAKNPVPLIIPCHRAIRSNLHLGGYQGGVKMKRDLLEKEGINFDNKERVICNTLYYD